MFAAPLWISDSTKMGTVFLFVSVVFSAYTGSNILTLLQDTKKVIAGVGNANISNTSGGVAGADSSSGAGASAGVENIQPAVLKTKAKK